MLKLTEIKDEWKNDCIINDLDIGTESIKNAKLHAKYISELIDRKLKLAELKSDYKLLRRVKFRYFRGELTKEELAQYELVQYQGPKHLKNEMNEILDGDEELVQILNRIEYNEITISTLESILKSIASRGYDIKNFIEYEKYRSGY